MTFHSEEMESDANILTHSRFSTYTSTYRRVERSWEDTYPENDKKSGSAHVVRNLTRITPRTKPVHSASFTNPVPGPVTASAGESIRTTRLAQLFTCGFSRNIDTPRSFTALTVTPLTGRWTRGDVEPDWVAAQKPEVSLLDTSLARASPNFGTCARARTRVSEVLQGT